AARPDGGSAALPAGRAEGRPLGKLRLAARARGLLGQLVAAGGAEAAAVRLGPALRTDHLVSGLDVELPAPLLPGVVRALRRHVGEPPVLGGRHLGGGVGGAGQAEALGGIEAAPADVGRAARAALEVALRGADGALEGGVAGG